MVLVIVALIFAFALIFAWVSRSLRDGRRADGRSNDVAVYAYTGGGSDGGHSGHCGGGSDGGFCSGDGGACG